MKKREREPRRACGKNRCSSTYVCHDECVHKKEEKRIFERTNIKRLVVKRENVIS